MKKRYLTSYLFILPIVILFCVFIIYPIGYNIVISFYNWNGISIDKVFVGFQNYSDLFHDRVMGTILKNFVIIALTTTIIQAVFGMIFASFFIRKIKFSSFYRIMFYIPVIATPTIIANIFLKIFETNNGYLNVMLQDLHLGFLCQSWLATPQFALGCIIFVNIWQWTGYSMLMYYTNMLNIPQELYEAATLDGANSVQQFTRITFPLLRGTHFTIFILGVIGALKCFDLPYLMTKGGPAHATETFSTYIYSRTYDLFNQGQASALACIMLVIAMIITVVQLRIYYRGDKDKELAG